MDRGKRSRSRSSKSGRSPFRRGERKYSPRRDRERQVSRSRSQSRSRGGNSSRNMREERVRPSSSGGYPRRRSQSPGPSNPHRGRSRERYSKDHGSFRSGSRPSSQQDRMGKDDRKAVPEKERGKGQDRRKDSQTKDRRSANGAALDNTLTSMSHGVIVLDRGGAAAPCRDMEDRLRRRRFSSSSSSSSESSSSSSSSSGSSPRRKKKKKKEEKSKHRKQKKVKRLKKKKTLKRKKTRKSSPHHKKSKKEDEKAKDLRKKTGPCETSTTMTSTSYAAAQAKLIATSPTMSVVTEEVTKQLSKRVIKPMTKEEWEKSQSCIRRVTSPSTGRTRLVRGDGEILEEIVSRTRHKEINKLATMADGHQFQTTVYFSETTLK